LNVSQPFLRTGHDYFTEFLAKLDCVTIPKGETLQAAFERAKRRKAPSKVLVIPNEGVQLLASLCRELQEMAGDQPFMLCQMTVAKVFGPSSHRSISNWIRALKTIGILKLAEPAISGVRAARYFYVEQGVPRQITSFFEKKKLDTMTSN
jgi:hypothetical protein